MKTKQTTWMCDNGYHGSSERRTVVDGWAAMTIGSCAGTVYSMSEGTETLCECECHEV